MSPHSLQEIKKQLQEENFISVPFDMSRQDIEKAIAAFFDFLSLPDEIKNKLYFKIDPDNRGTEVGYRRREQRLGDLDNRQYFHYNEYADEPFLMYAEQNPVTKKFLLEARNVYDHAKETLGDILKSFDSEFPGTHDKFFPSDVFPRFFLRFLAYDPAEKGEFLAKGHYDRGGCTLAIAESAPGLRIGKNDASLHELEHREGQALFFADLDFPSFTSEEFQPAWHDVIQKTENRLNDSVARWAIVFFADPIGMRNISFEEAHTQQY